MMQAFEAIPALDRLLGLLCRSLPAYLADAKPWTGAGRDQVEAAVERLAADQQRYARRVAEAIAQLGGQPDPGRFPVAFAAKNDLSLDFLLQEVLDCQKQDVALIALYAAQLERMPALHALAEEILGNAKGHLDVLKEMMRDEG
jgi:bacterioferritin (cytochrome b1)